ncbi:universal stress protein [Modestobacter sp. NPDC049651]|uniref:universal stress protein n=1 Tax=unclassified Modestobacter TaxID=2643866 RepID=UPI0033DC183A
MTEPADAAPALPAGVVLGLTGTPADEPGLRTALTEARRRGLPLHLLWPCPPAGHAVRTVGRRAEARYLERVRSVAAAVPGSTVTAELTTVAPARALVAASRTAGLLVLRPHAPSGAPPGYDPVVRDVVCHARCPVLVDRTRRDGCPTDGHGLRGVPGAPAEDTGGVVVGVDDGAADHLLTAAAAEARRRGTSLLVVHAAPARQASGPAARLSPPGPGRRPAGAGTGRGLADAVDRLRGHHPGLRVDLRVVEGAPGGALTALSRGADLVVLGRARRTGPLRRTTGAVVDRAACPVLVVPLPPPEGGPPPSGRLLSGAEPR